MTVGIPMDQALTHSLARFTPQRHSGSASDFAYLVLRHAIAGMWLMPGVIITEKCVSKLLEISATPVREAFSKLRKEHMVIAYPQRGTYVSKINIKLTLDAKLVRNTLEREAVNRLPKHFDPDLLAEMRYRQQMMRNAYDTQDSPGASAAFVENDNCFHRQLFVAADLTSLDDLVQQISGHNDRLRVLWLRAAPNWTIFMEEHEAMCDALENHDVKQFKRHWKAHFDGISMNYDKMIERYPDLFD